MKYLFWIIIIIIFSVNLIAGEKHISEMKDKRYKYVLVKLNNSSLIKFNSIQLKNNQIIGKLLLNGKSDTLSIYDVEYLKVNSGNYLVPIGLAGIAVGLIADLAYDKEGKLKSRFLIPGAIIGSLVGYLIKKTTIYKQDLKKPVDVGFLVSKNQIGLGLTYRF